MVAQSDSGDALPLLILSIRSFYESVSTFWEYLSRHGSGKGLEGAGYDYGVAWSWEEDSELMNILLGVYYLDNGVFWLAEIHKQQSVVHAILANKYKRSFEEV